MHKQRVSASDATSGKVEGTPHWLWTCITAAVVLSVVSRRRGSRVPATLLGPDFDGPSVSDVFSASSPLEVDKAN